jgi:hypothetical protein
MRLSASGFGLVLCGCGAKYKSLYTELNEALAEHGLEADMESEDATSKVLRDGAPLFPVPLREIANIWAECGREEGVRMAKNLILRLVEKHNG